MAKAGQALSRDEVLEVQAYHNAGVSLPDKFNSIVIDNTDHRGAIYRHATADEQKAADDAAKASAEAAAESERMTAKIRAEAAKRAVSDVPAMPAEPMPKEPK
jgi:hypothetical protein